MAAAFRGDLTRKWREQNPGVEPASDLLKRIRIERRKRWETAELDKLKAKGLTGDKLEAELAKRCKQYKEPAPVEITSLPKLPEGWIWVYGEYVVPVDAPIVYGIILPGPHIVPERLNGANITESSARLRPWVEFITSEYLAEVLRSPMLRHQFDKFRFGNAVQRLNIAHVRSLAIPLAPIEGQKVIGEIIRQRAKFSLDVLSEIDACSENLGKLYSTIPSKAFRGKLVSQDPNDEPASILLERIRQQKAAWQKSRGQDPSKETKK